MTSEIQSSLYDFN